METGASDKMQRADTTKEVSTVREYFYPDHGITVKAASQQEADAAVQKILEGATIKE